MLLTVSCWYVHAPAHWLKQNTIGLVIFEIKWLCSILHQNEPAHRNTKMPNDILQDWCIQRTSTEKYWDAKWYPTWLVHKQEYVTSNRQQQCSQYIVSSVTSCYTQRFETTSSYCIYSVLADSKNNAWCYLFKSPCYQ